MWWCECDELVGEYTDLSRTDVFIFLFEFSFVSLRGLCLTPVLLLVELSRDMLPSLVLTTCNNMCQ